MMYFQNRELPVTEPLKSQMEAHKRLEEQLEVQLSYMGPYSPHIFLFIYS